MYSNLEKSYMFGSLICKAWFHLNTTMQVLIHSLDMIVLLLYKFVFVKHVTCVM